MHALHLATWSCIISSPVNGHRAVDAAQHCSVGEGGLVQSQRNGEADGDGQTDLNADEQGAQAGRQPAQQVQLADLQACKEGATERKVL